jgi:hypothetical protein
MIGVFIARKHHLFEENPPDTLTSKVCSLYLQQLSMGFGMVNALLFIKMPVNAMEMHNGMEMQLANQSTQTS